ncbi:MAG TPA: serine hydrolase [Thermoanaerobaculia bacterium]
MRTIWLAVLLVTIPLSAADADLSGLWRAKRWFGPDARGAVVVEKSGDTYSADMMGRVVPVRVERGGLSFELPNAMGGFRGKVQKDGDLRGHWYPPNSTPRSFQYAAPLHLKADGAKRWRGELKPFDDTFTFFLMLTRRPDGSLTAFLRNPERDHGASVGAERLVVDGSAVKLMGRRRGQSEERVVGEGTWDAEREVLTLNFPWRGGTYDFRRDDDQSEFYARGRNPARYVYRPPLARADGWPTGTLDEANIDRAAIEKFIQGIVDTPMESAQTPVIEGVLIARHGKLVLEEYFHGEHRDKLHETRSAAKSLTATIVGAAIEAGLPVTLSTPVYSAMNGGVFPDGLEPRKRAMTLEHLLTMSSGYFCDDTNDAAPGNEDTMLDQPEEPDFYRFTLKVPMAFDPGQQAVYCSANPNLALGVLSRATGESPMAIFDRLVATPLKIERYGWFLDRAGNPYGGGGVHFLPRDFMKLGQLMLNGGTWQGKRILGRDFVGRASSPLYPLRGLGYGYLWWVTDYPYKDRSVRVFYAGGAGGQSTIVVPELDLVIATYGGSYTNGKAAHYISRDLTKNFILAAVR